MKTAEQLAKSADACLKRALKECENTMRDLERLRGGAPLARIMPRLRLQIHEVSKNTHEFSAYVNALDT